MAMTALAMTAHTMKAQIVADWLNALAVAVPWPLPVRPEYRKICSTPAQGKSWGYASRRLDWRFCW